jgi:DNA invertase Pin-like site-specific DNA recombinase
MPCERPLQSSQPPQNLVHAPEGGALIVSGFTARVGRAGGARSDRKHLMRLMGVLAKGDILIVTRLDRLARSTRDLLNLLGMIAEKGAGFKSLERHLGRHHDGAAA